MFKAWMLVKHGGWFVLGDNCVVGCVVWFLNVGQHCQGKNIKEFNNTILIIKAIIIIKIIIIKITIIITIVLLLLLLLIIIIIIIKYCYGVGGVWELTLVLFLFHVSLVFPTFDDTVSLVSPPRLMVYPTCGISVFEWLKCSSGGLRLHSRSRRTQKPLRT